MGRIVDGAASIRLALVVALTGALALLISSLLATNADASSAMMLTALAALVAAVVGHDRQLTTLVISLLARPLGSTDEGPHLLAARVTDTAHHPVRPRAPGVV